MTYLISSGTGRSINGQTFIKIPVSGLLSLESELYLNGSGLHVDLTGPCTRPSTRLCTSLHWTMWLLSSRQFLMLQSETNIHKSGFWSVLVFSCLYLAVFFCFFVFFCSGRQDWTLSMVSDSGVVTSDSQLNAITSGLR